VGAAAPAPAEEEEEEEEAKMNNETHRNLNTKNTRKTHQWVGLVLLCVFSS
jgi:hypothetical protein